MQFRLFSFALIILNCMDYSHCQGSRWRRSKRGGSYSARGAGDPSGIEAGAGLGAHAGAARPRLGRRCPPPALARHRPYFLGPGARRNGVFSVLSARLAGARGAEGAGPPRALRAKGCGRYPVRSSALLSHSPFLPGIQFFLFFCLSISISFWSSCPSPVRLLCLYLPHPRAPQIALNTD